MGKRKNISVFLMNGWVTILYCVHAWRRKTLMKNLLIFSKDMNISKEFLEPMEWGKAV